MKSEKQIQKEVINFLQWLENKGILYFLRTQSGMVQTKEGRFFKTGKSGAPDLVCCYQGKFLGIEVKTEKGKQTKSQREAQDKIEETGGMYLIVRDVGDLMWLKE